MKRFAEALAILAFCPPILAQPAAFQFEAADVHVSAPDAEQDGAFLPGGRIEFRASTLLQLIVAAYTIPADRIIGGPPWLDSDRYDVIAKAQGAPSQIAMRTMLQNLLGERFGLSVRQEDKPLPVFALSLARRGIAKEAKAGEPGCKRTIEDGVISLACFNTTMASLAETLSTVARGYFAYPVVDRTGLKGAYDFTLQWAGRGQLPPGPAGLTDGRSLYSSIEKALGLKIEPSTEPLPVLTVIAANNTPTRNAPDLAAKLGATPTEFDVADIRPSAPDEKENFKLENGRIEAKAIQLKDLIQFAYNVEDDALKGGAKWMETERFDITAKTAPTESADTLRIMLRSLLIERFGLKAHTDRQPVRVFALKAVKPKLEEADPSERSTCKMDMADGGRAYVCRNVTMAQFADKIRDVTGGYFDHPVVDFTGLKGRYDFTVSFAPKNRVFGRGGPPAQEGGKAAEEGPVPTGPDPTRELTIFEALERQMGLKAILEKHPMPVVVIDHVERRPTGN